MYLYIYDKSNNEKVIAKYLFYNIDIFPKFYLNQNIIIKKEKNLIQVLRQVNFQVFQNFVLMFNLRE